MPPFILISILVFALIVVGALVILVFARQKSLVELDAVEQGKHPKGYWMGIGLSFGFLFGYALAFVIGLLIDNMKNFIAIAPVIGGGLGISIGAALEQKNKDNIRPLTESEKQTQKWGVIIGLVLLVLGVLVFAAILFVRIG